MKNSGAYVLVFLISLSIPSFAQTNKGSASQTDQNAIIITFKDGHQESIALSDVAKIEFKTGPIAASRTSLRGERALFTGEWKVGVGGAPGSFYITLASDGSATKSIGSQHGKWEVVGREARISWDDGWHDVIRRTGNHYEKAAYAPGKPLTDSPTNVASATRTEPM